MDVRTKILSEATRRFAEKGVDGTSLQEISDAVGVRKPSLLYHFPSKDALHTSVLENILVRWNEAVPRLLNFGKVLRFLMSRRSGGPSLADFRDWPERGDARRMLADMVRRDTRLLFVFTGGAYHYFNHRAQLAASLGRAANSPQVKLEFWREYDHTFFLRKHRRVLLTRIVAWMQSEFDGAGSR